MLDPVGLHPISVTFFGAMLLLMMTWYMEAVMRLGKLLH